MPSFRGHEYEFTTDGVAGLMRLLNVERGSAARIIVTSESMPPDAVDIEYHWPNTIAVRLPLGEGWSDRGGYFMMQ